MITVRLRHVKIKNTEPWTDPSTMPSTLDVFMHDDPHFSLIKLAVMIRIIDGCTVPVRFIMLSSRLLSVPQYYNVMHVYMELTNVIYFFAGRPVLL